MRPITDETLYGTPDLPESPGLENCPARDLETGKCPEDCQCWLECGILNEEG